MSATNKTPNYDLPIFLASDKPQWLIDWNNAMTQIDTAIKNAGGAESEAGLIAEGAKTVADAAQTAATAANNTAAQANTLATEAKTEAQTATTEANKATSDVETLTQNLNITNEELTKTAAGLEDIENQVNGDNAKLRSALGISESGDLYDLLGTYVKEAYGSISPTNLELNRYWPNWISGVKPTDINLLLSTYINGLNSQMLTLNELLNAHNVEFSQFTGENYYGTFNVYNGLCGFGKIPKYQSQGPFYCFYLTGQMTAFISHDTNLQLLMDEEFHTLAQLSDQTMQEVYNDTNFTNVQYQAFNLTYNPTVFKQFINVNQTSGGTPEWLELQLRLTRADTTLKNIQIQFKLTPMGSTKPVGRQLNTMSNICAIITGQ